MDNIVDFKGRSKPPPVSDYWYAQVDARLSRIELMINRLEWQLWMIFCGCVCLLLVELLNIVKGTM